MSFTFRKLLWSSEDANDGKDLQAAGSGGKWYDGTNGDACEAHGGENNGAAQGRFAPASGKYAGLPGLPWTKDVKSFGTYWSQNPGDEDLSGALATGKAISHDYIIGGPTTRMEHVHYLDCSGFDYLKLYWQAKCMSYEGLAIDNTNVLALETGALVNLQMADYMRIAAAGMPAIDSRDSMFSIPKLMRINETDTLANEGYGNIIAMPTFIASAVTGLCTLSRAAAVNDDTVMLTTSAADLPNGFFIDTLYYIVQAAANHASCKLSLTLGGAPVIPSDAGTGTHTMHVTGFGPGSGRPRPIPMHTTALETTALWEPDLWVSGGEPLWVQWKGVVGGTIGNQNHWTSYDHVRPCLSWEKALLGGPSWQGGDGPLAITQNGKVYKSANDILKNYRWTKAGDKFEATCWLGYPHRAIQTTSGMGAAIGNTVLPQDCTPPLRITGLARIALVIGAIRLGWHGEGLSGGVCWTQAGRVDPTSASTFLKSTPVSPAVAPREHIRGRLWAVLIGDGGHE